MTNTNTAVAPKSGANKLKEILGGEAFKLAVAKALPKHLPPDRFLRVAQTAMTKTPKLAECDQASFLGALLTLSALGLEPDGRRAHLIPFENRKRGTVDCQLIVDWKGLVELAMRSGLVANLHADVVREGDLFIYSAGKLKSHVPWFLRRGDKDRPEHAGEVFAAYAIAEFKDGTTKAEVMSTDDIEAIRGRSRSGNSGPWVTDWNEMAKKTVLRRLSKWLVLSPEYRDALDADTEQDEPAAIPVFATVNAPFSLPEAAPETREEAPATTEQPAAKEANTAVVQGPSVKEILASIVSDAGYTFDNFMKWARETGQFTDAEADAITSFDEIPQAKAKTFVGAKSGLLKGLALVKGGGN